MQNETLTRPTVMERLRTETREFHDAIEKKLSVFDCIKTSAGYSRLLERMWGYYSAKEPALADISWNESGIDFPNRLKTPWLAEDLQTLGRLTDGLPKMKNVRQPETVAEAIGSLYVLEGATLGGQVILRQLKQNHIADDATHFYSAYGEKTGDRWMQFKKAANEYCVDDSQVRNAIAGAKKTFQEFTDWFATF